MTSRERERLEKAKDFSKREINGENIYILFCIWCNAFFESNGKNNINLFKKFLKRENKTLSFCHQKYLNEKYFSL